GRFVPVERAMRLPAAALIATISACSHPSAPRPTGPARFDVQVDARDPRALHVDAHYVNGGSATLSFPSATLPAIVRFEVEEQGSWRTLDPKRPLQAQACVAD